MSGRSPKRDRSAQPRANGVTKPALSSGFSRLEKHLGERLFDRSSRGIAPHTDLGQRSFGAGTVAFVGPRAAFEGVRVPADLVFLDAVFFLRKEPESSCRQ